jgi:hypothetical protein
MQDNKHLKEKKLTADKKCTLDKSVFILSVDKHIRENIPVSMEVKIINSYGMLKNNRTWKHQFPWTEPAALWPRT